MDKRGISHRPSSDISPRWRIHKLFSFHQKWRKGHHPLAKYVPRTVKPPQENLRLRIMPAHFTSLGNGIDDAPGIADCLLQADDHGIDMGAFEDLYRNPCHD